MNVPRKRVKQDPQKEKTGKMAKFDTFYLVTGLTSSIIFYFFWIAVSRPDGSDIAKPSNLSLGQCGSGCIISSSIDSQSQASTASQMENTHNIDCSHGERSEHGDLNDDSSTDFEGDVTRDNFQR